jgi:hypothetical protein
MKISTAAVFLACFFPVICAATQAASPLERKVLRQLETAALPNLFVWTDTCKGGKGQ